jgi:hypothetical protein
MANWSASRDIGALERLRGLDQPNDASISAFGGLSRSDQIEGVTDVGRTACDRLSHSFLDRNGFACQRRLVKHRDPSRDHAVDRHNVALPNQQPVADRKLVDRNTLKFAVAVKDGISRDA